MKTVYNPHHGLHAPRHEFFRGRLVPAFETPERADGVLAALRAEPLGPVVEPVDHGLAAIARVHTAPYLRFLRGAWDEWAALHAASAHGAEPVPDAFAAVWPVRTLRHDVEPRSFAARMGLYSIDSGTPFTAGAWPAAYAGAQATLTALDGLLRGEPGAYVLTRPPGHHAGADFFGGYCFINNAAVAAQAARDAGLARVAILDVDYHHGNGTQAIFYDRPDVFFASVHGDPLTEYPFYLGHADERGSGAGLGFNANFALPAGADNPAWFAALHAALERIAAFAPQLLVVSLGVDTFVGDPISHFRLDAAEFHRLGQALGSFAAPASGPALPTLLIQEGGYASADMGRNVRQVLEGFVAAHGRGAAGR